jgi:hypothetical protein
MTFEVYLDNSSHITTTIVLIEPLGLRNIAGNTDGRFTCRLVRVRLSAHSTYRHLMNCGTYHGNNFPGYVITIGSVVDLFGPVGSVVSVDSFDSVGSVFSIDAVGSVDAVHSVSLVVSVDSVDSVDSVGSVVSIDSVGSVGSVDSVGRL